MSLSKEHMLQVMSYVDGELEGEALDKVESLLASDADAAQLAAELRTLGDCVRVVHTDRELAKRPDEIADDVMAELDKRLAPIGSLAERRRNAFVAGAVCAGLAMAAGWLLFFQGQNDNLVEQANMMPSATAVATTPPVPTAIETATTPVQVASAQPAAEGVDVESVESPSHEVSVFYVPAMASANSNASSVVVWIQEGEAKK